MSFWTIRPYFANNPISDELRQRLKIKAFPEKVLDALKTAGFSS